MKGFRTILFVFALLLSLTAASAQTESIFQYDSNGNLTNVATATPAAPTITAPPTNQVVETGSDVSFSVDANGDGPLTYQWFQNGTAIPGATNSTIFLPGVTASSPQYSYTVEVCDSYGCVTSTPPAQVIFNWTWVASGAGDWYSPSNWDPASVPAGLDNITIPAGSIINLSAPVTIAGALACYGATINSNSLTIASNASLTLIGGTLNLSSQIVTENSTLNVTNGAVLNVSNTWVNSGSVAVNSTSGSTLNLAATLLNSNATLSVNATGGSWALRGGAILGGTVTEASTNNLLVQSGTLSSVTVNGGINMYAYANSSLIISNNLTINGPMLLGNGGTVVGGTITESNGAPFVVDGSAAFNGVTFNGVMDLGNTYDASILAVTNGLTLNGTLELGDPTNYQRGILNFEGTQAFGGNATVQMGRGNGGGNMNQVLVSLAGTTLTIGPGITIQGQNGVIGSGSGYDVGGPLNVSVIDQGTISANVTNGTIVVDAEPFSNEGVAQAINGGTLELENTWTSTGQVNDISGTLYITGDVVGTEIGTINETNGTVYLTGAIDNTGNTLLLTGSWILNGGAILNGTVVATNGFPLIVQGSGTFDGVTINGLIDVGRTYDATVLTVTGGMNVNGTVELGNVTNYERGILNFVGSQTLGGNGTVLMGRGNGGGNMNQMLVSVVGTTLTIGPGIAVQGQNGVIGSGSGYDVSGPLDVGVVNQGTIAATVSGGTIVVDADPFNNEGVAQAINGGSLEFEDTWNNTGQIDVGSGSVLNFNSNVTGTGIGTINNTNGTVELTGTVNNTGNTLVLPGTWILDGGTILGGTVEVTDMIVDGSGTFDGVTFNGSLDVANTYSGSALTVVDGLTLNGTALVGNPTNGWNGNMSFAGTQTLGGNGTVIFGNNGNYDYNALRLVDSGTTLTIGPGITVRGVRGTIGDAPDWGGSVANVGVINQGVIQADAGSGTITVNAEPFVNEGVAQAINGSAITLENSWSNSGQLNVGTNSVLNFEGSFTGGSLSGINRTNGTINMSGTMDNTTNTLVLSGALVLNGGTILNGTVVATNGASLVVDNGTFDGVTFNGLLDVGNSFNAVTLTVINGLTLNGTALVGNPTNSSYGDIAFAGSQTLGGIGTVIFGNNGNYDYNALRLLDSGTTLTIGPGITVRGQRGAIGDATDYSGSVANVGVINQGVIQADVGSGTITINAEPFNNEGVVQALNGSAITLENNWSNNGQLNVGTNSVLNLAGSFTGASLSGINRTNGTVNMSGTVDNTTNTLVLTGTLVLNGGTILNGTVVATSGFPFIVNGSGTFDGVTFNGLLDVANTYNGSALTIVNGLTLNGTALVGNPTNGWNGNMSFAGTQTLGGNGTVIFGNNGNYDYNALRLVDSGTTLTIGPGITVRGVRGTIGDAPDWGGSVANVGVINQGVIQADAGSGTITVNAEPFVNEGVAQAINGSAITLENSWSNSGQLNVGTNSVLNLAGSFTAGSVSGISRTNGAINVSGTVDNTTNTLLMAGAWTLNGGTILNGTVIATNGSLAVDNGTFDGVTFNGLLDVGNTFSAITLTVVNGLTLNGTALLGNPTNSSYGDIAFAGTQTLGGIGTVIFGNNGNYDYNALRLLDSGTTLTIGPGITVRGQRGAIGDATDYSGSVANVGVINQGVIQADVGSGTITINAEPFNNEGVVQALNGSAITLENNWSNSGQLNAGTNSVLNLGGTVAGTGIGTINRTNGTINLTGTVNNSGNTLVLPGVWQLNGGSINGGTVVATNGAALVVEGQSAAFAAVTFNGLLDLGFTYDAALLTVVNGLTLNGTVELGNPTNYERGIMDFEGSQTLGGNGTVVMGRGNGGGNMNQVLVSLAGTTLTTGPGITIQGQNGVIGSGSGYDVGGPLFVGVVNEGTISANVSGGTIAVDADPFVNDGLLSATLGAASLTGTLNLTNGTLAFGLSNPTTFGKITVSGNAPLAGAVSASLLGGFLPAVNNSFPVLSYGSESGIFTSANLPAGFVWQTNYGPTTFTLSVSSVSAFNPVLQAVLKSSPFAFQFNAPTSGTYTVLASTNLALPLSNWSTLGSPSLLSNSLYQFTDTQSSSNPARFYILRIP